MNEDERKIREAVEKLPVDTWQSLTGYGMGVVVVLAAAIVPMGFFATWTIGLSIGGLVVKLVSAVLDSIAKFMVPLPVANLISLFSAWILKIVGSGLLIAGRFWGLFSIVFICLCWVFVSRRNIRFTGEWSSKLTEQRSGYARLDSVVRRAAKES